VAVQVYKILALQTLPGVLTLRGPKTLRTQDISALVPKCLVDTSAPVPKCLGHFGTSAELSWTLRHH